METGLNPEELVHLELGKAECGLIRKGWQGAVILAEHLFSVVLTHPESTGPWPLLWKVDVCLCYVDKVHVWRDSIL